MIDVYANDRLPFEVSNAETVDAFKKAFCAKKEIAYDDFKIRIISKGVEMKDELKLAAYKLEEEAILQLMKTKKQGKQ